MAACAPRTRTERRSSTTPIIRQYQQLLQEEVKPWSYMKFPHIRSLGPEHGWYRVGPLARVQICDFIPSLAGGGGAQEVHRRGRRQAGARRAALPLGAADRDALRGRDDARSARRSGHPRRGLHGRQGPAAEEGIGVIEAPRGTLFHHYRVDEDGLVSFCNLIVSTTNNNQAMNEAIRVVATQYLDGREVTEGLLNHIEVAIRAYDPVCHARPMRSARCLSRSISSTPTGRWSRGRAKRERRLSSIAALDCLRR